MAANLGSGSTVPQFITGFDETEFIDNPQEGDSLFVIAEDTNLLILPDTGDVATGGDGTDVLQGNGGDDNIQGAAGNDFVFGNDGDDIVRGDEGDDVVVGGRGSDIAIGGSGSDVFEFFADQIVEGEVDIIRDFELGSDSIVVVGSTNVSYEEQSGLLFVDGIKTATLEAGLDVDVLTRTNSSVVF